MFKKAFLALFVGLLFTNVVLTACTPTEPAADVNTTLPAKTPLVELPPITPDITKNPNLAVPPTPTIEAYPPSTENLVPGEYPAPSEKNTIWLVQAKGQQCEAPKYETLEAAVKELTTAGVTVLDSKEVALTVTTSCESPTSEHYFVQIEVVNLTLAQNNGWQVDNSTDN